MVERYERRSKYGFSVNDKNGGDYLGEYVSRPAFVDKEPSIFLDERKQGTLCAVMRW